jgi:hypothetical protein
LEKGPCGWCEAMPPCLFWRASGFGYFSALAADMGDFGRSQQTIKADLLRGFNSRMTVQGNPVEKKLLFFRFPTCFSTFSVLGVGSKLLLSPRSGLLQTS